jgi:tRNA nucleotidyltransferase (CCA-adding enzyme)
MNTRTETEEAVLSSVRPQQEEVDDICAVAEMLLKAVNESGTAQGMVVGSVARNTWISGDRDIDVFMLYPPDMSRETLEEDGIILGRSIASRFGGLFVEKYAEHPYVNATISGFDVDLVPLCSDRCRTHPERGGPDAVSHPVYPVAYRRP